ncbi:hypothetical protein [Macromonas bipunctata]|uniref:hypothetical protein n=1 Tax=Macromonas bipunctata TaxID=183670 RepID=UPI000C33C9BB|nr:hypothetical protein [Macromonas bipunctata]
MMKKRIAAVLVVSTLGVLATPAMAQFSNLLGGLTGGSSSAAAADPQTFVASAQAAEKLMNNSVALLSQSLVSKEKAAALEAQRKAANETTDPAEKQAKLTEVRKSEMAALNESMANSQIESAVKKTSGKQREDLAAASFNFMLALLQDKALVEQGKGLVSSLSSNPMNITKMGGVKDAVSSMTNQISAASSIATKMPAIFTAVGVKAPTSKDEKPKTMTQVEGD